MVENLAAAISIYFLALSFLFSFIGVCWSLSDGPDRALAQIQTLKERKFYKIAEILNGLLGIVLYILVLIIVL